MAKLWDFYNGEPFMENPHLAIVGNPSKRKSNQKGKTKMARRKTARRKARRNGPLTTAGLVLNRPRRKRNRTYTMRKNRRGVYAYNPPRRKKSYRRNAGRRNPAVLGVSLPPISMIAWGAGGFIAPPMVEGFINQFLPVEFGSSVLGRYAVKIGSVLGLTYLAKTVLSNREAFPVAFGGTMYVVVSAINEFVPQLTGAAVPATAPVQAYRSGMIKAYRSGMISTGVNSGLNQYSKTNLAGALPRLAAGPRWGLGPSGMENPTQADPRFAVARY